MTEEQLQQKYLQLQLVDQQAKQLQQQILTLEHQILEFKTIEESLNNISKTKNNTSLYSPLGLGMFIQAELKNNKEILMNVGSKTIVKKTIPEANDLLKKQTKQIEDAIKTLKAQLSNSIAMITKLSKEIETSTSKLKKK